VLITNNQVLKETDIIQGKKIKLILNNKNLEIKIDKLRKTYTNKEYDITIIEIKKTDGLDFDSFLDIDDNIMKNELEKSFVKKEIYIIYSQNGDNQYSIGIIKSINDNYIIRHSCSTVSGSSGSPIINRDNYKVIGVHKGEALNKNNWNLGTIIKPKMGLTSAEYAEVCYDFWVG
jgi:V8-like Glu-specific endopeptidase